MMRRTDIYLIAGIVSLGLLAVTPASVASQAQSFTTIDFPGATRTLALGSNDLGDTVGWYVGGPGSLHGFLLSRGEFTSVDFPGANRTIVRDINNRGDIVGRYALPSEGFLHGFLLTKDDFSSIDVPGSVRTVAYGINDRGDIVGSSFDGTAQSGFRLRKGVFAVIDLPEADETVAFRINNRGDVVGAHGDTGGSPAVFSWTRTAFRHSFFRAPT